jgi:hypothetical protein
MSDRHCQHYQCDSQAHIRRLHGRGFVQTVRLQNIRSHGSDFIHALWGGAQNEQAAEEWRQEGAQRIKCLRQIQPTRCGFRLSQHRDVRIRGYLQAGDSRSQNDQSAQKQWV